jgi:hypothetical protein
MYIAYYVMRTDGDGDFCAVIENGEWTSLELSRLLSNAIEQKLKEQGEDWFKVDGLECDFPDVWDLTTDWDSPKRDV